MAFTSGTATDYQDLLDKLRLYLVAEGWTQLAWAPGGSLASESVLKMRGPGAGPGRQVFVNFRTVWDTVSSIYSWQFRTSPTYDGALGWGAQLSEQPNDSYFNLWQNAIDYWFYVNDRRMIVVAKTGTNYVSMHAGFFLPWGTPVQYPFPLFGCGDYNSAVVYSTNNAARRMFCDPGNVSDATPNGWARSADGIWYPIAQVGNAALTNRHFGPNKGSRGWLWPYSAGYGAANGVGQYNPLSWNGGAGTFDHEWNGEHMATTQQGERCLLPIMVCGGDIGPMGVIDGAYAVGGLGLGPEQIITLGARDFRVFQNVQRNSPDDFFCVEEV